MFKNGKELIGSQKAIYILHSLKTWPGIEPGTFVYRAPCQLSIVCYHTYSSWPSYSLEKSKPFAIGASRTDQFGPIFSTFFPGIALRQVCEGLAKDFEGGVGRLYEPLMQAGSVRQSVAQSMGI